MERFGGSRDASGYSDTARLVSAAIQILLYADAIVLIFNSAEELQIHLHALKTFYTNKGFVSNLDKTKMMMFSTIKHG